MKRKNQIAAPVIATSTGNQIAQFILCFSSSLLELIPIHHMVNLYQFCIGSYDLWKKLGCARAALFVPEFHKLSYHSGLGVFLVVSEDTNSSKFLMHYKLVVF